jgi:hypothetical protein
LSSPARLLNVSARAQVGTGDDVAIAGFVIAGNSSKQVLIRGIGPGLTAFGVNDVLPAPVVQVFSGGTLIATNAAWGTGQFAAIIPSVSSQVGAFSLAPGSADAALLLTLRPGAYTAQVADSGGRQGIALIEVYEVQ